MRLILAEGAHAINALQGLLETAFACTTAHSGSRPEWFNPPRGSGMTLRELRSPAGHTIFIQSVGGKSNMGRALELALGPARIADTEKLGLCFDPDNEEEIAWRGWMEAVLGQAPHLAWVRNGWNYD